ncbi:MAG: hypothetical protein U0271_46835 [Polyangiaceae bacterium]
MDDLVEVGSYDDRVSAELRRAHLANHGIESTIVESLSTHPILNIAAGGARLLTSTAEAEAARGLLIELEARTTDEEGEEVLRCPRCESEYVYFEAARPRPSAAVGPVLTVASAMSLGGKQWRCRECEHTWGNAAPDAMKRTALPTGEAKPVFRLKRTQLLQGGLVGFSAGFVVALLAGAYQPLLFFGLFGLGLAIGQARVTLLCSAPNCRAELDRQNDNCPRCGGKIVGDIARAIDHGPRAADYRRALAEETAKQLQRRKRKARRAAPERSGP